MKRNVSGSVLFCMFSAIAVMSWSLRSGGMAEASAVAPPTLRSIVGARNVEDIIPVTGTRWVYGINGPACGQSGTLYVFNVDAGSVHVVDPRNLEIGNGCVLQGLRRSAESGRIRDEWNRRPACRRETFKSVCCESRRST